MRRDARRLSGRRHRVLTGVSVRQARTRGRPRRDDDGEFKPLTDDEIDWYVASGEGRDKAGAYAIRAGVAVHSAHRGVVFECRRACRSRPCTSLLPRLHRDPSSGYSDAGRHSPEVLMTHRYIKIGATSVVLVARVCGPAVVHAAGWHRVLQARRRGDDEAAGVGRQDAAAPRLRRARIDPAKRDSLEYRFKVQNNPARRRHGNIVDASTPASCRIRSRARRKSC